jgi:hypothetical protein
LAPQFSPALQSNSSVDARDPDDCRIVDAVGLLGRVALADNGAMESEPIRQRSFQFTLRSMLIGVALLAVACWALLSRVRLIEERDEARRFADNYKRLAEEWHAVVSDDPESESATPRGATSGVVPDGRTAIRIALAVWGPVYGDDKIAGEKPYVARLENGVWTVEGSLPNDRMVGGTAYIEINKADGKVLKVTHYK